MSKATARFLHIADIHLGYDRYDSSERSKDFFRTFQAVVRRYGIEAEVDFILIAGDLFEHRNILPHVLNQAQLVLGEVRAAGIPVLAIEGNHDNRPYGVKTSWLRYLADHDYLLLLEPTTAETGGMALTPWDPARKRGGYLDLACGVRVIGSQWYGSAAPTAIADLATMIADLPPAPGQTVLMFHHGLEGEVSRYAGALRYGELKPLRAVGVDYLALGHIHKNYEKDGWIFNPGSLEANSVAEAAYRRGAYLVSVGPTGIEAELKTDYPQRPLYRLKVEATGRETAAALRQKMQTEIENADIDPATQPIVECRLQGTLSCERYELAVKEWEQEIQAQTGALIVLLKVEATALAYDVAPNLQEDEERLRIETAVFGDLLAPKYRDRQASLAQLLLNLKEVWGDGGSEAQMYALIEANWLGEADQSNPEGSDPEGGDPEVSGSEASDGDNPAPTEPRHELASQAEPNHQESQGLKLCGSDPSALDRPDPAKATPQGQTEPAAQNLSLDLSIPGLDAGTGETTNGGETP